LCASVGTIKKCFDTLDARCKNEDHFFDVYFTQIMKRLIIAKPGISVETFTE